MDGQMNEGMKELDGQTDILPHWPSLKPYLSSHRVQLVPVHGLTHSHTYDPGLPKQVPLLRQGREGQTSSNWHSLPDPTTETLYYTTLHSSHVVSTWYNVSFNTLVTYRGCGWTCHTVYNITYITTVTTPAIPTITSITIHIIST